MLLLLALAVPVVAAGLVFPRLGAGVWPQMLGWCLAAGAGLGASSCTFFLWYPLFGHPGLEFIGVELVVLVLSAALAVSRSRGHAAPPSPSAAGGGARWLWVPLLIAAGFATVYWSAQYQRDPHGEWDSVGIWNARARFLYRSTDNWTDAFSPINWHTDYPLLVPATVARCWVYLNEDSTIAPAVVGWVAAALTAGVLVSGLNVLRGGGQGWLAGTALLCTGQYLRIAAYQTADVPLGYFVLATALLLALHDRGGRASLWLPIAAGVFAGLAAWTKNEGLLFVVAVFTARLLVGVAARNRRALAREMAGLAAGMLPAGLILVYFKTRYAPPNDLVSGQGAGTVAKLLDPARHARILEAVGTTVWDFGPVMPAVLAAFFLLLGPCPAAKHGPGLFGVVALLVFMAAGYYTVYLTTPHDLAWHLSTSLIRLVVQLWPLTLFAVFFAARTFGEAAGARPAAVDQA